MDNSFIFFIEENLDNKIMDNFLNNILITNNEKMNILFECIFNNYLLLLFTISSFSTLFCCKHRIKYKYRLLPQKDNKEEFVKGCPV